MNHVCYLRLILLKEISFCATDNVFEETQQCEFYCDTTMNSVNNDIENFNVFDYARKTNSYSLLEVAIQNLELYGLHVNSGDKDGNTLLHIISHKGNSNDNSTKF
jgi:predicted AlkP superfamily phosphohydrolase/phosphomutase